MKIINANGNLLALKQITKLPDYSIAKSLPLSRFYQFADLAFDQITLQGANMADIELAMQVVGLV